MIVLGFRKFLREPPHYRMTLKQDWQRERSSSFINASKRLRPNREYNVAITLSINPSTIPPSIGYQQLSQCLQYLHFIWLVDFPRHFIKMILHVSLDWNRDRKKGLTNLPSKESSAYHAISFHGKIDEMWKKLTVGADWLKKIIRILNLLNKS